jgi:hypothetical protein
VFLESAHVSPQESGARIEISKTENEGGKAGERTVYISGLQDKGTPVCQVWFAGFRGPLNHLALQLTGSAN